MRKTNVFWMVSRIVCQGFAERKYRREGGGGGGGGVGGGNGGGFGGDGGGGGGVVGCGGLGGLGVGVISVVFSDKSENPRVGMVMVLVIKASEL